MEAAAAETSLGLLKKTRQLFESIGENPDEEELKGFLSRFQGLEDDFESKETADSAPKGKKIKPKPGFCIKTTDSNEAKVFVNICQSPDVPPPPYKSNVELLEILQNGSDGGYRVPMSLTDPRPENDKSGRTCDVYDVIINNDFFGTLENNEVSKSVVMSIVLMGIEDKYKITLNTESAIVLKNRKYLGTFVKERLVQDRKDATPLITEIEGHTKVPDYTLTKKLISADGNDKQLIIGEFKLDGIMNLNDITLDLGEDRIVLNANEKYHLDVFLPYDIIQDDAKARFDRIKQVLTVTMPLVQAKN